MDLDNFSFLDRVPHEEVPHYPAAADACLVHLAANELYKMTLPSKLYEYMAMDKPILMGVEGETAQLLAYSIKMSNFDRMFRAQLNDEGKPVFFLIGLGPTIQ